MVAQNINFLKTISEPSLFPLSFLNSQVTTICQSFNILTKCGNTLKQPSNKNMLQRKQQELFFAVFEKVKFPILACKGNFNKGEMKKN